MNAERNPRTCGDFHFNEVLLRRTLFFENRFVEFIVEDHKSYLNLDRFGLERWSQFLLAVRLAALVQSKQPTERRRL